MREPSFLSLEDILHIHSQEILVSGGEPHIRDEEGIKACRVPQDGRHATTHWRSLDWMRESFPSVQVDGSKHFVRDGHVYTSAGIYAGIDMALVVIAEYLGQQVARATAKHMEYPYPENAARKIEL